MRPGYTVKRGPTLEEYEGAARERASSCTVRAVVGQGYRVNSDEWWTFDTEKYSFFHEQCCDCGLNHKTHVRLEGTKIHFRHERRDRPPTPDEIDNSDLPNAPLERTAVAGTLRGVVGNSGGGQ